MKEQNTATYTCCSNRVDAIELAEPIVENLLRLQDGVPMYDVTLKETVLVIAPVLLFIADNPMAAELCNHQGSCARRFCRMCLVSVLCAHLLLYTKLIIMYFEGRQNFST